MSLGHVEGHVPKKHNRHPLLRERRVAVLAAHELGHGDHAVDPHPHEHVDLALLTIFAPGMDCEKRQIPVGVEHAADALDRILAELAPQAAEDHPDHVRAARDHAAGKVVGHIAQPLGDCLHPLDRLGRDPQFGCPAADHKRSGGPGHARRLGDLGDRYTTGTVCCGGREGGHDGIIVSARPIRRRPASGMTSSGVAATSGSPTSTARWSVGSWPDPAV